MHSPEEQLIFKTWGWRFGIFLIFSNLIAYFWVWFWAYQSLLIPGIDRSSAGSARIWHGTWVETWFGLLLIFPFLQFVVGLGLAFQRPIGNGIALIVASVISAIAAAYHAHYIQ